PIATTTGPERAIFARKIRIRPKGKLGLDSNGSTPRRKKPPSRKFFLARTSTPTPPKARVRWARLGRGPDARHGTSFEPDGRSPRDAALWGGYFPLPTYRARITAFSTKVR